MTRNEKIEKCIELHKFFIEKSSLYGDMAMQANNPKHQMRHWDKYWNYSRLGKRASKLANKLFEYQR
ncbi:hypothetical protein L3073_05960 [Ancylomarina sp. DW003]|nr:hypothetical protein [Ancylomarina sp. DW003]MDE5421745.1 hypothetical protein [Ancylomarina sp. DW003]